MNGKKYEELTMEDTEISGWGLCSECKHRYNDNYDYPCVKCFHNIIYRKCEPDGRKTYWEKLIDKDL